MINYIYRRSRSLENGWDPISSEYGAQYIERSRNCVDMEMIDLFEGWFPGSRGSSVLDLGGGPGFYSTELARRGYSVTLYDISRYYLAQAEKEAISSNVKIDCKIGWLDDCSMVLKKKFDFVFSRVCWNYCGNDWVFSSRIVDCLNTGGSLFIKVDTLNSGIIRGARVNWRGFLNQYCGWKIGHPSPPENRVIRCLSRFRFQEYHCIKVEEGRELIVCKNKL